MKKTKDHIKKGACHNCDGGDVQWIATESGMGYEAAKCLACGCMMHTQFMCQGNVCEWHDHCKECGAELCMCCYDGNCYVCDKIFSSQGAAQQATFFGSEYIDGW